jgi:flavin-dependent dehydrogenase
MNYDVVIIGGGPAGSTCGALIKKYAPSLSVLLLERETFPRDHIGESQLPLVSRVLDEMGVWNEVEAANYPVKIGATYRWGNDDTLWDFHFLPNGEFADEERPAPYRGQRLATAFQVDRSSYDDILLKHAEKMGCLVRQGTKVRSANHRDDQVAGLVLESGEEVTGRYYVDATGHVGFLRRALGVSVTEPSNLKNVAFWDYWRNAEWAVKIGVGGTRIQIMSLGYGWIWFIPLGPDRTSIGFVCPAEYYKRSGLSPQDLYRKAIQDEPRIRGLLQNATPEGKFEGTKDWSFVADRLAGKNWFLVGESSGFADPILSAGLTLTHVGAREAAYTLVELLREANGSPKLEESWLKAEYETQNRGRVLQHIRFADYWYTANSNFSELKEFTREIAKDAGLVYDADRAWQWLGTGGFVETEDGTAGLGGYSIGAVNDILVRLMEVKPPTEMPQSGASGFTLNLEGALRTRAAFYENGEIRPVDTFVRGKKRLRLQGPAGWLAMAYSRSNRVDNAMQFLRGVVPGKNVDQIPDFWKLINNSMDAMVRDGWLVRKDVPAAPALKVNYDVENPYVATNVDDQLPLERRAATIAPPISK